MNATITSAPNVCYHEQRFQLHHKISRWDLSLFWLPHAIFSCNLKLNRYTFCTLSMLQLAFVLISDKNIFLSHTIFVSLTLFLYHHATKHFSFTFSLSTKFWYFYWNTNKYIDTQVHATTEICSLNWIDLTKDSHCYSLESNSIIQLPLEHRITKEKLTVNRFWNYLERLFANTFELWNVMM